MTPEQVARRRAVEALRSGVPSRDAVLALGSGQSDAEDRFVTTLEAAEHERAGGLLLGAGFGAGKSHLLMHLEQVALDRGFAVSTVVISKETPLFDPAKVFRSAVESLARLVGGDPEDRTAPLVAVLAVTDDFEAAVLTGKNDRGKIPAKLRDKQSEEWSELAGLAEKGMRHIERDVLLLDLPDAAELDRAYQVLKQLHGSAYDWTPPDVPGLERLGATRMRQYVRAWINAWDLVRLDPDYQPDTRWWRSTAPTTRTTRWSRMPRPADAVAPAGQVPRPTR